MEISIISKLRSAEATLGTSFCRDALKVLNFDTLYVIKAALGLRKIDDYLSDEDRARLPQLKPNSAEAQAVLLTSETKFELERRRVLQRVEGHIPWRLRSGFNLKP